MRPQIGDLVKMKRGYSEPGLVLELIRSAEMTKWVRVLWPDYGPGTEKARDLEVINASR